jgi:hypothetical protein
VHHWSNPSRRVRRKEGIVRAVNGLEEERGNSRRDAEAQRKTEQKKKQEPEGK